LILQLFTILGFTLIAFQDLKERMVHWILFPIVGVLLAHTHFRNTDINFFLFSIGINLLTISALLTILWAYTKFIKKNKFLNTSFGLGDVLFLYAFALGFPPLSFIVLLASSICFSLLAFVILNYFKKEETVPLAGFMGIFLGTILILNLLTNSFSLYLM